VCFACSSLSIGKDSSIESLQHRVNYRLCTCIIDFTLNRLRTKNCIESKLGFVALLFHNNGPIFRVKRLNDGLCLFLIWKLFLTKRPQSNIYLDSFLRRFLLAGFRYLLLLNFYNFFIVKHVLIPNIGSKHLNNRVFNVYSFVRLVILLFWLVVLVGCFLDWRAERCFGVRASLFLLAFLGLKGNFKLLLTWSISGRLH